MHSSLFFKLFPPPKYLTMKYTGLHIAEDSIYCLEYKNHLDGLGISKYGRVDLPTGTIVAGEVRDEKTFRQALSGFEREHGLTYVKVSVPEEKAYLFQTDVPEGTVRSMAQNIESKLEENVPLAASDALFYFDILPLSVTGGALKASVSVVSRSYIERSIGFLKEAGIQPVAFEVLPKSIARAIIPPDMQGAELIVHAMPKKTGIYIVSGGVVCFTSTMGWNSGGENEKDPNIDALIKEISRVYTYWAAHSPATSAINSIFLVGRAATCIEEPLQAAMADLKIKVSMADVWQNILNLDRYVPPISKHDSLDYVVAAGLAMVK